MLEPRAYHPKKLTPRHFAIMRELIAGTRSGQLATIFGYTPTRMSIIINSPRFVVEMGKLKEEVESRYAEVEGGRQGAIERARTFLDKEITPSLERVVDLRKNAVSESVVLNAATELLDRAGVNKVDKVMVHTKMDVSDSLKFALGIEVKEDGGVDTERIEPAKTKVA